jgi:hypothetical protein
VAGEATPKATRPRERWLRGLFCKATSERGGERLLTGTLVAIAYVAPTVVFGLALRPAAETIERVGRATAR